MIVKVRPYDFSVHLTVVQTRRAGMNPNIVPTFTEVTVHRFLLFGIQDFLYQLRRVVISGTISPSPVLDTNIKQSYRARFSSVNFVPSLLISRCYTRGKGELTL